MVGASTSILEASSVPPLQSDTIGCVNFLERGPLSTVLIAVQKTSKDPPISAVLGISLDLSARAFVQTPLFCLACHLAMLSCCDCTQFIIIISITQQPCALPQSNSMHGR
jgi:hypothetical protein